MVHINYPAALVAGSAPILCSFGQIFLYPEALEEWKKLKKPKFTMPDWALGPIWIGLDGLMGYASYQVFIKGGGFQGKAFYPLLSYGALIAAFSHWAPLFASNKRKRCAFYLSASYIPLALLTAWSFDRIDRTAGLCMILPCAQLVYETIISIFILRQNSMIS